MRALVREILDQYAKRALVTIGAHEMLFVAAQRMCDEKVHSLIVEDRPGRPFIGIFTEHDFVRAVAERKGNVAAVQVFSYMTKDLATCTSDTLIADVKRLMMQRRIRHVPVIDSDKIVAVISIGDVTHFQATLAEVHQDLVDERMRI